MKPAVEPVTGPSFPREPCLSDGRLAGFRGARGPDGRCRNAASWPEQALRPWRFAGIMQSTTILFVEDDKDVRQSTAEVLAAHGFHTLVADSAEAALPLLAREKVDILFADIVMPGLNGIELAKEAKRHHPGIKTLLMTAYYSRAAEARELADKLLFKPLRGGEIIAELDALLAPA